MSSLKQDWERFWFEPIATSSLAVLRIAYGLVLTVSTLTLAPDVSSFLYRGGVLPDHPVRVWTPSLLRLFTGDVAVVVLYVLLLLSAVAITIGLRPQIAAAIASVVMYSFLARNFFVFNAGDELLQVIAFYLIFAPSGASLSVDRWLRDRGDFWAFPLRQPWAFRLIQVQVSIIYLFTLMEKIHGQTWYNGTAVSYALRLEYLQRFALPDSITTSPVVVNLMTYGTLATELSMAVLIWNRRARPWVIGLGIGLHLMIDVNIVIGFFSFLMIALYLAFVPPETMSRTVLALRDRWRRRRSPRPAAEPVPG